MSDHLKRMTFVATPEIKELLDAMKKEVFYNHTQSAMIRELVLAGVRASKAEKEKRRERAS